MQSEEAVKHILALVHALPPQLQSEVWKHAPERSENKEFLDSFKSLWNKVINANAIDEDDLRVMGEIMIVFGMVLLRVWVFFL